MATNKSPDGLFQSSSLIKTTYLVMGAGSRGIDLLKWMIVCTVVCAILLLLRFWSSRIQKRKAYADDWMVLIAFVSLTSLLSTYLPKDARASE